MQQQKKRRFIHNTRGKNQGNRVNDKKDFLFLKMTLKTDKNPEKHSFYT